MMLVTCIGICIGVAIIYAIMCGMSALVELIVWALDTIFGLMGVWILVAAFAALVLFILKKEHFI